VAHPVHQRAGILAGPHRGHAEPHHGSDLSVGARGRQGVAVGGSHDHPGLQIRQVLDIRDGGQPPCTHVTGLISQRLGEVEARLAELSRARDQLVMLAGRAAAQDPANCGGYCSIIAG
jgi:MerR, DNA binding